MDKRGIANNPDESGGTPSGTTLKSSLILSKISAVSGWGTVIFLAGICVQVIWHVGALGVTMEIVGGILWILAMLSSAAFSATAELRNRYGQVKGVILALSIPLFLAGFPYILTLLAAGKIPSDMYANASDNPWNLLLSIVGVGLLVAIPGILIVYPEIQRRWLPFQYASGLACRLLPTMLAAAASFVTASYLFLQHFAGGALSNISLGPLTVALLAVITLLTPLYRLIARVSWERGIAKLLDPSRWCGDVKAVWSEVIHSAERPVIIGSLHQPVEHDVHLSTHLEDKLMAAEFIGSKIMGKQRDPVAARARLNSLSIDFQETFGPCDRRTLVVRLHLAEWTGIAGDPEGARDQFAELVPIFKRVFGTRSEQTRNARDSYIKWRDVAILGIRGTAEM